MSINSFDNINAELSADRTELSDEQLIRHFYHHISFCEQRFNISYIIRRVEMHKYYKYAEDDIKTAGRLTVLLSTYPTADILEIIEKDFTPFAIEKKDVPQFSDIDNVCKVPYLLCNCGLSSVDYAQMGYMLRNDRRGLVADRKYGENHLKTACQMGLCSIENYKGSINELGRFFAGLEKEMQSKVLPKLCLKIPFMQNYYVNGTSEEKLEKLMSILSPTTIKRRLTNVKTLIRIIDKAIEDGF